MHHRRTIPKNGRGRILRPCNYSSAIAWPRIHGEPRVMASARESRASEIESCWAIVSRFELDRSASTARVRRTVGYSFRRPHGRRRTQ